MATMTETKPLTAAGLMRLYSEGVRAELIRGVLCETMPAGVVHSEIMFNVGTELRNFVKPKRLGRLAALSGILLEKSPDTVRKADISFFSRQKIPPGVRITGYSEVVPDLVVEVKSPSDSMREVFDKARMWSSFGVPLVWVLYPDSRTVAVHPTGAAVSTLSDADKLDGGDVLPGFTCNISEIFDTDI